MEFRIALYTPRLSLTRGIIPLLTFDGSKIYMFQAREQCRAFISHNEVDIVYVCVNDISTADDTKKWVIESSLNKNASVLFHFPIDMQALDLQRKLIAEASPRPAEATLEPVMPEQTSNHSDSGTPTFREESPPRNYKILLADADMGSTGLISSILTRNGYRVITVHDGKEALDMARKETPDLMIMDLVLPKYGGGEITRILRKEMEKASKPVILISSSKDKNMEEVAQKCDANGFLRKPVEAEKLIATIRGLLKES